MAFDFMRSGYPGLLTKQIFKESFSIAPLVYINKMTIILPDLIDYPHVKTMIFGNPSIFFALLLILKTTFSARISQRIRYPNLPVTLWASKAKT